MAKDEISEIAKLALKEKVRPVLNIMAPHQIIIIITTFSNIYIALSR